MSWGTSMSSGGPGWCDRWWLHFGATSLRWKRSKVARNVASLVDAPLGEDVEVEPLTQEEARQNLRVAAGAERTGLKARDSPQSNCNRS